MTKKDLRKVYKVKRIALGLQEQHVLFAKLLQQAEQLLSFTPRIVFAYKSSTRHHELPIELLLEWWQTNTDTFRIALPKVEDETMQAIEINEQTVLVKNKFGIEEPQQGNEIHPLDLDVVLVPLLAFDKQGFRVGYGKGYYDKYLKHVKQTTRIIGISYFNAEDSIDDIEPYDVPLTHCITPNQLYVFRQF